MVSNVEKSVKSSSSKSVVKSIKSVFSKKSKSKSTNEASNVVMAEDELVKESTIVENVDEARDMPEHHESNPLDASQIEELQKIVKSAESTISKAQGEEVASKKSNKSVLSRLFPKGEESSPAPIPEDAEVMIEKALTSTEATDEKAPTNTEKEQTENDTQEEKAGEPSGNEDVKETVAAVTLVVSEDIPSPSPTRKNAAEEVAKPGFFCFSCQ